MIYLPDFDNDDCIILDNLNNGYIRVYDRIPTPNSSVNYVDYYVDYDYIKKTGTQNFSNYNYNLNCQSHDNFTNDFYYRIDFDSIMIIFFVILFIVYFMGFKPISRIFGRWLKL